VNALRVVSGTVFFPRGGSAYVTRALASGLCDLGIDLTLVAGSRTDLGGMSDARRFYAGLDVRAVDFAPALASRDPMRFPGAPLHGSFEDRPGAPDRVFAELDDVAYKRHVDAWAATLRDAGAGAADVLHLHHLTPLNAAAAVAARGVPVVGHVHGTELLMLEAIADEAPWAHGEVWARRLREWAAQCAALVVAPGNAPRAAALLNLSDERLAPLPNGFDPAVFRPLDVDSRAVWERVLVDEPRGWRPGAEAPGSVRYARSDVDALLRGPVILYVGRFTAVKRLSLLLEAFADARARMAAPASLVVVGGHPGEWEGEHPAEAIARLGLADAVRLAGWYGQDELPELLSAADLLVLASARESFGQVLVEAMACGVPPIAAASHGPVHIVDDGATGWLFDVDDRAALTAALVAAADDGAERARRARRARETALERFAWPSIAGRVAEVLRSAAGLPTLAAQAG
jgi:glycosyltransferase involved in cell wall biosynthesis